MQKWYFLEKNSNLKGVSIFCQSLRGQNIAITHLDHLWIWLLPQLYGFSGSLNLQLLWRRWLKVNSVTWVMICLTICFNWIRLDINIVNLFWIKNVREMIAHGTRARFFFNFRALPIWANLTSHIHQSLVNFCNTMIWSFLYAN